MCSFMGRWDKQYGKLSAVRNTLCWSSPSFKIDDKDENSTHISEIMLDRMRDYGLFGGDIVLGIELANNLMAKHEEEEDSNPKDFTQNLVEICNLFINSSLAWKVKHILLHIPIHKFKFFNNFCSFDSWHYHL